MSPTRKQRYVTYDRIHDRIDDGIYDAIYDPIDDEETHIERISETQRLDSGRGFLELGSLLGF